MIVLKSANENRTNGAPSKLIYIQDIYFILRRQNISRNTLPTKKMFVIKTLYFRGGKATLQKFILKLTPWEQEWQ